MGWSLSYHPPKEAALLDEFFLAVGKALYLANAFESKCRFVLRTAKLVQHFEETDDASATMEFAKILKDKMLGQTISELKGFPEIRPDDIAVVEKAKDARNFIAHEGASFGYVDSASAKHIKEQLEHLRREVAVLTAGDNVVSRWVYEIEEKEPAPRLIQEAYPKWVEQWVFGTTHTAWRTNIEGGIN